MKKFYGAKHDLFNQINTHLFVISPNNSGSTLLKEVFAESSNTWNLNKEGQHTFGYSGPCTRNTKVPLIWASTKEWQEHFKDKSKFNWVSTKKAWYFQAFSKDPSSTVFFTKAPPFLLIVDQLKSSFKNSHFIFLIRNPYAVVEGISRRYKNNLKKHENIFNIAAMHITHCMRYQKSNIETYKENSIFFTYEEMCNNHKDVQKQIESLIPQLNDINLTQELLVKGIYKEPLRNMNEQQISRLTKEELETINKVFNKNKDILDYFGYELIK